MFSTSLSKLTSKRMWAIVLAGGDGIRLQSLTRQISGDSRPKQFCPIFAGKTLLRQTRDRIEPLFRRDRTMFVVTRPHAPFYREELSDTDDSCLVVYNPKIGEPASL